MAYKTSPYSDLDWLTAAIMGEAATENDRGMAAVADVLRNRTLGTLRPNTDYGTDFTYSPNTYAGQYTAYSTGKDGPVPQFSSYDRDQTAKESGGGSAAYNNYVNALTKGAAGFSGSGLAAYNRARSIAQSFVDPNSPDFNRYTGSSGGADFFANKDAPSGFLRSDRFQNQRIGNQDFFRLKSLGNFTSWDDPRAGITYDSANPLNDWLTTNQLRTAVNGQTTPTDPASSGVFGPDGINGIFQRGYFTGNSDTGSTLPADASLTANLANLKFNADGSLGSDFSPWGSGRIPEGLTPLTSQQAAQGVLQASGYDTSDPNKFSNLDALLRNGTSLGELGEMVGTSHDALQYAQSQGIDPNSWLRSWEQPTTTTPISSGADLTTYPLSQDFSSPVVPPPAPTPTVPPTDGSVIPPTSVPTIPGMDAPIIPPTSGSVIPPTYGSTVGPDPAGTIPPTYTSPLAPLDGSTVPPPGSTPLVPASPIDGSKVPPAAGSAIPPVDGYTIPPADPSPLAPLPGTTTAQPYDWTQTPSGPAYTDLPSTDGSIIPPPETTSPLPPDYTSPLAPLDASTVAPTYAGTVAPLDASTVAPTYTSPLAPLDASTIPAQDASLIGPQDAQTIGPDQAQTIGANDAPLANGHFDAAEYLRLNPDVAQAGVDPYEHFAHYGINEHRQGAPDFSGTFDGQAYLEQNPDVAAAHVDPFMHWLRTGQTEGRLGAEFDQTGPYHYGSFGLGGPQAFQGGGSTVGFDPAAYLRANADVARSGMDPWQHYLQYGINEHRQGAPDMGGGTFDGAAYLRQNPDVAAAGIDPLEHWLRNGLAEHRLGAEFDFTGPYQYGSFGLGGGGSFMGAGSGAPPAAPAAPPAPTFNSDPWGFSGANVSGGVAPGGFGDSAPNPEAYNLFPQLPPPGTYPEGVPQTPPPGTYTPASPGLSQSQAQAAYFNALQAANTRTLQQNAASNAALQHSLSGPLTSSNLYFQPTYSPISPVGWL